MRRNSRVLVAIVCLTFVFAALGNLRAGDVPVMRQGHMEMTLHASPRPGDAARAAAIVNAASNLVRKYADVSAAERDGYRKFLPAIPLPVEHYTSMSNAILSAFSFDPQRPTSLIYQRTAKGLVAVGVMYTAPNRLDAAQLDARVPLSFGTWHRHIDFCRPPPGVHGDRRFGVAGSIDSAAACAAAGGRFTPRVFSWMVHVWPNASTPAKVWAVDGDAMADHHTEGMVEDSTMLPVSPSTHQ